MKKKNLTETNIFLDGEVSHCEKYEHIAYDMMPLNTLTTYKILTFKMKERFTKVVVELPTLPHIHLCVWHDAELLLVPRSCNH